MTINYVSEKGEIFGTTSYIGIGQRKPELVYGKKAKELREKKGLSTDELSKELSIKKELIEGIEKTEKGMTEAIMSKYMNYFDVAKEFFFDTDLNVYILNDRGNVLKTFTSSEECKKAFEFLKQEFLEGCKEGVKNFSMFVDFSKGSE